MMALKGNVQIHQRLTFQHFIIHQTHKRFMMRPSEKINLHPPTHSPSELPTKTFDVICIGSGWAGRVLAARIVAAGFTAVIIENELIGGDCPFWACIPSKVLLRSPEALSVAKGIAGARERITGDRVDVAATFQRRDIITRGWDDTKALVPLVEGTGVQLVRGTGTIVGVKNVKVTPTQGDSLELEARLAVVLCTGSEPLMPDIPGLRGANAWSPRDATSSNYVPDHLIIMGGGAVGCEMATAYSRFGTKVTLISSSQEILPGFDPEAGMIVRESLESGGVTFNLGSRVVFVQRPAEKEVIVELSTGEHVRATELLVATGRKAKLEGLGLESVGVSANDRFLAVDESLCVKGTTEKWLYAAGDINGRALLTHTSKYHAAIAANEIIANSKDEGNKKGDWCNREATADNHAVPQVVFTDPVAASVGLTRKAAKAKGMYVREINAPMAGPGYNIHADDVAKGCAQWLLDEEDCIVGATFVGTDAAELLYASTVAIVGRVKLSRMMHCIPSFPTLSWVYYNLMDAAGV